MNRPRAASWLETTLKIPPADRPSHRVFAVTVWLSAALCAAAGVQSALSSLTALLATNVLSVAVALTSLRWLDTDHPERAAQVLLWGFLFTLTVGALATTPYEPTMLGYLFAIPVVSANMLGAAETRRWFARVIIAGVITVLLGEHGLVVPQADPLPTLTKLFNFVATITATMGLLQAMSTASTRANQRTLEAERAKSAFFANIGHEIRTPMNGVLGMTEALLQRPLAPPERDMVATIRSSGGVMLALLDDLLDLSKLDAGKLQLHEHPVPLADLADELRLLWGPMATKKGLTLNVWLGAGLPAEVRLDGRRLRQVLANLLSNALKFTQLGSVTVRLEEAGGALRCSVEDTGIGINPQERERLFARFAQADDARARRYQGAGLGLALSRDLAQLMGGALTVTSTPGQGSCFVCTLPLVPVGSSAPPPNPQPRALPPGLRVLVVDDNPVNRLVAQRLLDRTGCTVEVVEDGQSALTALARSAFDLVLMDVHMPDMDGLEVTRRLRSRGERTVRIIGVSASAETDDVQSCKEAGMNDFLAKPMTRERLLQALLRQVG